MFDSSTSDSGFWHERRLPKRTSRFATTIFLLNTAIFSIALFDKALSRPSTLLIVASAAVVCLSIPIATYAIRRAYFDVDQADQSRAGVPQRWWVRIAEIVGAIALLVCISGDWVGLPGKHWSDLSDIALPFSSLFAAMQSSKSFPDDLDKEDGKGMRFAAFAYNAGRRIGGLFASSVGITRST